MALTATQRNLRTAPMCFAPVPRSAAIALSPMHRCIHACATFFFFFLPSLSLSPPSLSLPPSHAHTFGLAQSCAIALPAVSHMVFFWGGGSGLCSFVDVVSVVIGYRLHQTSKLPPPARFCIIAKMFPLPPPFLCFFVCSFVSVGMCMLVNSAFLCSVVALIRAAAILSSYRLVTRSPKVSPPPFAS